MYSLAMKMQLMVSAVKTVSSRYHGSTEEGVYISEIKCFSYPRFNPKPLKREGITICFLRTLPALLFCDSMIPQG